MRAWTLGFRAAARLHDVHTVRVHRLCQIGRMVETQAHRLHHAPTPPSRQSVCSHPPDSNLSAFPLPYHSMLLSFSEASTLSSEAAFRRLAVSSGVRSAQYSAYAQQSHKLRVVML